MVKSYACCSTMAIDGRKLYFFEKETNEIYYYNIENQEEKCLCSFSEEKYMEPYFWGNTHIYKNNVVLVPRAGAEVLVINSTTGKTVIIEVSEKYESEKCVSNFIFSKVIQEKLYLVGAAFPGIIEVDLESYDVKQIKCKEIYNEQEKTETESIFVRGAIYEDGYFIIPLTYKNQICFYDPIQRRVVKKQDVPWEGVGFSGVCKVGDDYWMTSRKDNVVLHLDEKWKTKAFITMPHDSNASVRLLGCFAFYKKPLFYTENGCRLWQINSGERELVPFIDDKYIFYESNLICSNHMIYAYDEIRHHLLLVEEDGSFKRNIVRIGKPKQKMNVEGGVCYEKNTMDLISYIETVYSA